MLASREITINGDCFMLNHLKRRLCASAVASLALLVMITAAPSAQAEFFDKFEWREVNHGVGTVWEPRAGLQAVIVRRSTPLMRRHFARSTMTPGSSRSTGAMMRTSGTLRS